MLEEMESNTLTLLSEQDVSHRIDLWCWVCNEENPKHPKQRVGEAFVDGSGQWFVVRVERYGKGYPKASAESRWAPRGLILQVYWPDGSAIDAQLEGFNWEMHLEDLVGGDDAASAVVGQRRVGVFRCQNAIGLVQEIWRSYSNGLK